MTISENVHFFPFKIQGLDPYLRTKVLCLLPKGSIMEDQLGLLTRQQDY